MECVYFAAVDCSLLEPPLNGQVMVMGTTLGSRAHYSCDLGYVLLGSVVRTCGPDGLWSNLEPLCSGISYGGRYTERFYFISRRGH